MTTIRRKAVAAAVMSLVAAGAFVASPVRIALAGVPVIFDGMPTQDWLDQSSADGQNSSSQGTWGDMAGGVAARPVVRQLSVINGGGTTQLIADGHDTKASTVPGGVTAVVAPINLCKGGQAPHPGSCYSTPNRVALSVVYRGTGNNGSNFAHPSVGTLTPTVDADTVIDLTVALNTLGQTLRWSWVNGDLLYWQTSNLGQPDATVHVRFKPAYAPYVQNWPDGSGCTATPIFNCNLPHADGETLNATMLLSLDQTLDPALTGAVFATRNAISGYLQPGNSPDGPTLDIQAGSTHTRSDGTPQYGTVQAFIPAGALLNLYGVLPTDAATFFTTARTGDPGTNDAPIYTPWTAPANGSDGLLVTVGHITFSVPKYKVKSKLGPVSSTARAKGANATVTATLAACNATTPCLADVYRLSRPGAARYVASSTAVLTGQRVQSKALSLVVTKSRLTKGDRYLLVVHAAKTRKVLTSTLGQVG